MLISSYNLNHDDIIKSKHLAEVRQEVERHYILSMMTYTQIEHTDVIQQVRRDYLRTLVAPMDGMWEAATIAHATFWEIQDQGRHAGHFCLDSNKCLLRFHLLEDYQAQAQEIFRWIVSTYGIRYAITSTIEPFYFSLCLDVQKSLIPQNYLFRDHKRVELSNDLSKGIFRKAEKSESDSIARFYRENTEGSGEWIETFLCEHLEREELFVWYDQQTLIATGECIPSQRQAPYADLGMIVAQSYRGRGLGSSTLLQLK